MTTPTNQAWWYVEVLLKPKFFPNDGDVTLKFVNRPFIEGTLGAFHPLLKSISGLGNKMGDYLPEGTKGQIVIDNSSNTFGYERRFSDTLERYTLIGQTVKVYAAQTVIDDLDPTSDFVLAWQGKCTSYQTSFSGGESSISLDISSEIIPRRIVTKVIDSTQFPSAPSGSIGNHLPIVFGTSVEVKPIRTNADASTTPIWAYATTFANKFVVGGVQTYYAKDSDSKYQSVTNPASTSTLLGGRAAATPSPSTAFLSGISEAAEPIVNFTGGIITNGTYYYATDTVSLPTSDIDLVISVYKKNPAFSTDSFPGELLGKGRFTVAAAGLVVNTVYSKDLSFDKPLVLDSSQSYFLSVSAMIDSARIGFDYLLTVKNSGAANTSVARKYFDIATTNNAEWENVLNLQSVFQLYGVRFDDDVNPSASEINQEGLGHAFVQASQKSAASGQVNPDISKLDLIFGVNGLKDDTSGTITGTVSATIESSLYALRMLDYTWNGSAWVAGVISASESSSTGIRQVAADLYNRFLEGRTDGSVLLTDIYTQICRSSACRIYQFNHATTPLAVWGWGQTKATSAVIDDEDAQIISVQQLGTESIVNRLQMFYARGLTSQDFGRGTAEGEFKDYRASVDWYNGLNALVTELIDRSEDVYGKRVLREQGFNWLSETTSAENVAHYLLATFGLPHVFVTIDVPYFKYSTLDMMKVIEITHPDLPAYFGTSAAANPPTYGTVEVDLIAGNYWKRANRYRALIEGKEIQFNVDQFPVMRLTCRILENYPKDPT